MNQYILSLDSGTTSQRSIIFNDLMQTIATGQKEFTQIFPQPGWVEHDAEEIFASLVETMHKAIQTAAITPKEIKAIGITNQRETTVIWDKRTQKPVYNAIVWQCRRTSAICENLKEKDMGEYIRENTGLLIDAYFSATKIRWILDHIENGQQRAERGDLLFGTIDSFLIYKFTKGRIHVTDYTNASRTMLYNIKQLKWDEKILSALNIPMSMMPEVVASYGTVGYIDKEFLGEEIPIAGIAGDQQSALFGQCCFEKGEAKNTYGTGCFMLMNTGNKAVTSKNGLLTTMACSTPEDITYALEGSIFMGGALIQWLRDSLGLLRTAQESEEIAFSIPDSQGVYIVPAFSGLGAPYWDMYAKGIIMNLSRGVTKNHIIRASLEAIAYQVVDLVKAIENDASIHLKELNVDGGAAQNDFLLMFQSDILRSAVNRPIIIESTALGAALLAGLGIGIFKDKNQIKSIRKTETIFSPKMPEEESRRLYNGWKDAVRMCMAHK